MTEPARPPARSRARLALRGVTRGRYATILADPPWEFKTYSSKGLKKSPQAHYACVPLPDLKRMPIASLAAPDCFLFMWTTSPMLPQSLELLAAWGFTYKGLGVWAKQSATGKHWHFGTGYCYRGAAEFWIYGTRGHPKAQSRSIRNLIVAPVREHSRKPDQMHRDLEALTPAPRLELFARQRRPQWDAWGNQVDKFPILEEAA